MTWMKKSTTTMETREMRLEKLQLVIDEQSPMRIKPDSLIFLVKRKLQDHYVLLNRRQMLREWHTTRHMFHSEIGVQSVLRVADEGLRIDELLREQDGGYSAEIPDGLHVHWNRGREQNSAMYHIRGNAQWSSDQLHVRSRKGGYEDLTREILRHFEAYGFCNPVIIQCDKEMSIIDVCRKVARERNARTVLIFAPKNKSSE